MVSVSVRCCDYNAAQTDRAGLVAMVDTGDGYFGSDGGWVDPYTEREAPLSRRVLGPIVTSRSAIPAAAELLY